MERPYHNPQEPTPEAIAAMQAPADPNLTYRCAPCERYFDRGELKIVAAGTGVILQCPACGLAVREERSRPVVTFAALLADAVKYPLQKEALIAELALGIMGWAFYTLLGGGALLELSVVAAYFLEVARHTADGSDHPPMPADYVDLSDPIRPAFRCFFALSVAYAPALLIGVRADGPVASWTALAYALFGSIYLPGGLILAAHSNGWFAPANVAKAIALASRVGRKYMLTVVVLGIAMPFGFWLWNFLATNAIVLPVPVVPGVVAHTIACYVPVALGRLLGLVVREHAHQL